MKTEDERAWEYVERNPKAINTADLKICSVASFIAGAQSEREERGIFMNEYQEKAMETCLPTCGNDMYMLFGLVEEVGEVAGKISKAIRKNHIDVNLNKMCQSSSVDADQFTVYDLFEQIKGELGDCCWFIAGIARQFGWTLDEVAQHNLNKLAERKESGTIVTHTDH